MAATTNNLKLIYGGAIFGANYGFNPEKVVEALQSLQHHGFTSIDTAQAYKESEEFLGESNASSMGFEIDTKVAGGLWPHVHHTREAVIKAGEESVRALRMNQVDVYYIHAPDRKVPIKETLYGINELYKADRFKRFGLSNFTPEQVEDVIRIAKGNDFVLPSVYQGNYNAADRRAEKKLIPLLRDNSIAFYAYSPLAGGFLTKTPEDIKQGKGRFNKDVEYVGLMYNTLYNTPAKLNFIVEFGKIATDIGISQADLAHRWLAYHSELKPETGDGIVVGSRVGSQLDETLAGFKKGPLSAETAQKVIDLSNIIRGEEDLDLWNDYISNLI